MSEGVRVVMEGVRGVMEGVRVVSEDVRVVERGEGGWRADLKGTNCGWMWVIGNV